MKLQRGIMREKTIPDHGWHRAYLAALANACLFLFVSAINKASGAAGIGIHVGTALIFFIGSTASFFLFIRNGGGLAAISFFVLGAGIFFGLGTAYSTVAGNSIGFFLLYPPDEQARTLPAINLLNAVSVVLVLLAAWPMSRRNYKKKDAATGVKNTMDLLKPLAMPMLLLSVPVILLAIKTFPLAQNLLLRNFVANGEAIILLSIVLSCMRWSSVPFLERVLPILLFWAATVLGLLSMSKTEAMFPTLAVVAALWLDSRSRRLASILGVSAVVIYFTIVAPLCNNGRAHPLYNADDNTISERFEILWDVFNAPSQYSRPSTSGLPLLNRFAAAPIQAFLIERYDGGSPGNSLASAWEAVIPRLFWPSKPNITRFGAGLDGLFFGRSNSESGLGPTYSAEGYWNGGWIGLTIVSLLLGLEIGWLTRKWNLFVQEGLKHVGILALSIRVIMLSVWVETWFVATYVGGFVTLVVLIKAADWVIPMLLRRRPKTAPVFAFSMRRAARKSDVLP